MTMTIKGASYASCNYCLAYSGLIWYLPAPYLSILRHFVTFLSGRSVLALIGSCLWV